MGMRRWKRHSAVIIRTRRWAALRQQALRRDGYACVKCGAAGRLQVDHMQPVRTHPALAFELTNLQCLCPACHSSKTRLEVGHLPLPPERAAWRDAVRALEKARPPSSERKSKCSTQ